MCALLAVEAPRQMLVCRAPVIHQRRALRSRTSQRPLQLIGLTDLRRLLVDNYEQLDEKTRSLIRLQRVYILAD